MMKKSKTLRNSSTVHGLGIRVPSSKGETGGEHGEIKGARLLEALKRAAAKTKHNTKGGAGPFALRPPPANNISPLHARFPDNLFPKLGYSIFSKLTEIGTEDEGDRKDKVRIGKVPKISIRESVAAPGSEFCGESTFESVMRLSAEREESEKIRPADSLGGVGRLRDILCDMEVPASDALQDELCALEQKLADSVDGCCPKCGSQWMYDILRKSPCPCRVCSDCSYMERYAFWMYGVDFHSKWVEYVPESPALAGMDWR